jgi:hypothetical protein
LSKYRQNRNGVSSAKLFFGWTQSQFPFRVRSGRKLRITKPPVIRVIGKAFFDIGHAPADQSNRRRDLQGYAAWEIHPVMKIEVSALNSGAPIAAMNSSSWCSKTASNLFNRRELKKTFGARINTE